jgi:hypothetical protein
VTKGHVNNIQPSLESDRDMTETRLAILSEMIT